MTPSRPASVTVALALVSGSLGSHGVAAGRASQQDVGDPSVPPECADSPARIVNNSRPKTSVRQ